MQRKATFLVLAVASFLGATCAAWPREDVLSEGNREFRGGYVKPCSLDGVNPVHHPYIFGNPIVARSFGFFVGPDRRWHVVPNCHIW